MYEIHGPNNVDPRTVPALEIKIPAGGEPVLRIDQDGTVHFKDQSTAAQALAREITNILRGTPSEPLPIKA